MSITCGTCKVPISVADFVDHTAVCVNTSSNAATKRTTRSMVDSASKTPENNLSSAPDKGGRRPIDEDNVNNATPPLHKKIKTEPGLEIKADPLASPCHFCGKKFIYAIQLNEHMKKHFDTMPVSLNGTPTSFSNPAVDTTNSQPSSATASTNHTQGSAASPMAFSTPNRNLTTVNGHFNGPSHTATNRWPTPAYTTPARAMDDTLPALSYNTPRFSQIVALTTNGSNQSSTDSESPARPQPEQSSQVPNGYLVHFLTELSTQLENMAGTVNDLRQRTEIFEASIMLKLSQIEKKFSVKRETQ